MAQQIICSEQNKIPTKYREERRVQKIRQFLSKKIHREQTGYGSITVLNMFYTHDTSTMKLLS